MTSSAFSAAECTLASCIPIAWQAALASGHDKASFMSVYSGGGDGGGSEGDGGVSGLGGGVSGLGGGGEGLGGGGEGLGGGGEGLGGGGEGLGGGGEGLGGCGEGGGGGGGGGGDAIQSMFQPQLVARLGVMPPLFTYTRKPVAVIECSDDPPFAVQWPLLPARLLEMIGGCVKPHPERSTSR